jgi:phosphoglycolate phosphatase-like HAD superfamily hydrolase
VIEIGWEMPILIRALVLGISEIEILQNWSRIADNIVREEQLQAEIIGPHLDRVRDEWINTDLSGWLGLHRFYPGVIERIKPLIEQSFPVYIITTKEERFVRSLLEEQGVNIPENQIFGKGYKRPKYEILRELLTNIEPTPHIWFIEDRLQTLLSVQQQPDLNNVQLFLADWGYNIQRERDLASESSAINLLSLSQFSQDFSGY